MITLASPISKDSEESWFPMKVIINLFRHLRTEEVARVVGNPALILILGRHDAQRDGALLEIEQAGVRACITHRAGFMGDYYVLGQETRELFLVIAHLENVNHLFACLLAD